MKSMFSCVFALLMVVKIADALQCYECEQDDKHNCSWESKTCAAVDTHCFVISVTRPDGVEYKKRGCIDGDNCEIVTQGVKLLLKNLMQMDVDPKCVTCQGDKCNSATKLTGFGFIGFVLAALYFLL